MLHNQNLFIDLPNKRTIKTNKMKTQNNFEIGQVVTYNVCASTYTGVIVKIKNNSLIVIDCASGMALWNAGYSVGDEITFNQVI